MFDVLNCIRVYVCARRRLPGPMGTDCYVRLPVCVGGWVVGGERECVDFSGLLVF